MNEVRSRTDTVIQRLTDLRADDDEIIHVVTSATKDEIARLVTVTDAELLVMIAGARVEFELHSNEPVDLDRELVGDDWMTLLTEAEKVVPLSIPTVRAWVGTDTGRAKAAWALEEQASARPRLLTKLAEVIDGPAS